MLEIHVACKKKVRDLNNPSLVMDFEGTVASDSANPGRTFGVVGNPTITTAYSKNGLSSLAVPNGSVLNTPVSADLIFAGDFWYEMWGRCIDANPVGTSGGLNILFGYGNYPNAPGLLRFGIEGLYPTIRMPNGSADAPLITGSSPISYNNWHHFALGRKNNLVYLFLDGQLQGTAAFAGTFGFGERFIIGAYEDGRINNSSYASWNGYIDRLRVYDKCLNTAAFIPSTDLY